MLLKKMPYSMSFKICQNTVVVEKMPYQGMSSKICQNKVCIVFVKIKSQKVMFSSKKAIPWYAVQNMSEYNMSSKKCLID